MRKITKLMFALAMFAGGVTSANAEGTAKLKFSSSGVAEIDLADITTSGKVTFDPATGELTGTGTWGDNFQLSFDNADFRNVTNISVNATVDGDYKDIVWRATITDAVNGVINTWYNSKFNITFNEEQHAKSGNITTILWEINSEETGNGKIKINSITIKADPMTVLSAHEIPIVSLPHYDVKLNGTQIEVTLGNAIAAYYGVPAETILGDGQGNLDEYIDIEDYDELRIYTEDVVRAFMIPEDLTEKNVGQNQPKQLYTQEFSGNQTIFSKGIDGEETYYYATIEDIKNACGNHAKLIGVKAASWGQQATVNKIVVYKKNPTVDYDYSVSGMYSSEVSLSAIGSDATATIIDCTGLYGKGVAVSCANPNALFIANTDGVLSNDKNVIIDGICGNLVLTDNHPFKAPADGFIATKATYSTTITKAGTLCLPFAATIPEGTTAYTLTYTDGETATATPVETTIPANTPVLLNGSGAAAFTGSTVEVKTNADNTASALTGVFAETTVPVGSYVLQNQNESIGFYKVAEGSTITAKPFRAYLTAEVAAARLNIVYGGETTGISTVDTQNADAEAIYTLNGVRVSQPTKGIYVKNGQKFIVK